MPWPTSPPRAGPWDPRRSSAGGPGDVAAGLARPPGPLAPGSDAPRAGDPGHTPRPGWRCRPERCSTDRAPAARTRFRAARTHRPARTRMDILLETRGLTRDFSGFIAVNAVDLRVRRGSIHALIGPSGAGKTTLFNLLTRFLRGERAAQVH